MKRYLRGIEMRNIADWSRDGERKKRSIRCLPAASSLDDLERHHTAPQGRAPEAQVCNTHLHIPSRRAARILSTRRLLRWKRI